MSRETYFNPYFTSPVRFLWLIRMVTVQATRYLKSLERFTIVIPEVRDLPNKEKLKSLDPLTRKEEYFQQDLIIKLCWEHGVPWLFLDIRPYHSSVLTSSLDCIRHHHYQVVLRARSPLTLSLDIRPYHPSLLTSSLDCIRHRHRPDEC